MPASRQSITLGAANQDTTVTCPVTVNAGTNRLMVIAVSCEDATAVVAAPTFDGQTAVQAPSGETAAGTWSHVELWRIIAPNVVSGTVSVGISGAGAKRARIAVWVFDGADQTTPLRTCAENHGESATSASATVSGVVSTDYLIDAATCDSVPHAYTAGANQTEQYDTDNGPSGSFTMYGSSQAGSDGGVMSVSWSGTAGPFSYLATAVIEAAVVVQEAQPVATVSAGSWTAVGAATLHEATDETAPGGAGDTDYAESPVATVGGDETKVRVGSLSDPGVGTGHVVKYRYGKDGSGGDTVNLIVNLYRADGTTLVATTTISDIDAITTGSFTLTGTEADSIPSADYATGLVLGFKEVKV